jgi:hypothetical protein
VEIEGERGEKQERDIYDERIPVSGVSQLGALVKE